MNFKKIYRVGKDFSLSIIASAIVTGVLQIAVYPYLAKKYGADEYGIILTVMGVVNIFITALGNTLNNTRLIQEDIYRKKELHGDYNALLWIACVTAGVVVLGISGSMTNLSLINRVFLMAATVGGVLRSYYCVQYRIVLDFTKNMISNCVVAAGYIVGILVYNFYENWPVIFVMGEVIGLIYIIKTCEIVHEKMQFTILFKETSLKYVMLIVTGLLGNILVYLDRLLLLPSLGGEAVSIYTVASFFGKTLGIVMTPIAGVLLGYYAQKNFAMNRKLFWIINSSVLIVSAAFFLVTVLLGEWFTGILYPELIEQSAPYMILANLASIINATASMTQPSVLKYAPTYWQIIIQCVYCIGYIGLGVIMMQKWGIMGFCVAALIANLLRLLLLYVLGNNYIKSSY